MQAILPRLHNLAFAPVLSALPEGVERLAISPHQSLHLFPLHALPLEGGRRVADAFEVLYAPSFSLLHRCAERKPGGKGAFVLVDNPACNLLFTSVEGESLARRFRAKGDVIRLSGAAATREAMLSAAPGGRVLHYTGHAAFDGRDPLGSKLVLSGGALTLREAFSRLRLPRNALTVLNGCECALSLPDLLDDFHSLTTGFLFAGSPCVVSTLWAIPDLPSALLMDKFHERWLAGCPPAAALRLAQQRVRDLQAGEELNREMAEFTRGLPDPLVRKCHEQAALYVREFGDRPFASPVHWAAFQCSGLGWRPSA
jgi:CHAT domain-containing protein